VPASSTVSWFITENQMQDDIQDDTPDDIVQALNRQLADDGQIIEGGWAALRKCFIPDNASASQVRAMRFAYLAGCQHVWASVFAALDAEERIGERDIERMVRLDAEMEQVSRELERIVKGNAARSGH